MLNSFHKKTTLIGLIGKPIYHSYSPLIFNISIELKKMDFIYLPFNVDEKQLKNAINGISAYGIKGLNVTIPHKVQVIKYLDNISEEASIIGAVNTICNSSGKLFGYNTDTTGIYQSLLPYALELSNKNISVIGAGGASRAVVYTLIKYFNPQSISIINRTSTRGEEIKDYFNSKMKYPYIRNLSFENTDINSTLLQSTLIVNTTPIGMFPNISNEISIFNKYTFNSEQIVFDLIYNPEKTQLLKKAEKEGAEIILGLKMLIHQAAQSFEIWTGEKMPIEEVTKSVKYMLTD